MASSLCDLISAVKCSCDVDGHISNVSQAFTQDLIPLNSQSFTEEFIVWQQESHT